LNPLRQSLRADCGRGRVEAGPEPAMSKVRWRLGSRGLAGDELGQGSHRRFSGQLAVGGREWPRGTETVMEACTMASFHLFYDVYRHPSTSCYFALVHE